MTHDPVADPALAQLRDVLQRYLQVADVLGAAVEALQPPFEPNAESFGPHLGSVQGEHAAVGRAHASYTIKGFQQRLSEVPGVATVTLQESGGGIRFLVEMFEPAY